MRLHGPPRVDLALALALTLVAEATILTGAVGEGPRQLTMPLALLMTLPLAWRRTHPVAAASVLALTTTAQALVYRPANSILSLLIIFIAAYSVAAHSTLRRALWGGLIVLACIQADLLTDPTTDPLSRVIGAVVLVGAPWVVGFAMRRHHLQSMQLRRLMHDLEVERQDSERAAVARERAAIARELHDIVAHTVGVMVVQAGAAEETLNKDPDRARQTVAQIRTTGREALSDLRRLLGVLRSEESGPDDSPQPGLEHLAALTEQLQQSGLAVDLKVEGEPLTLSAGLNLTAFRIVQEALTNVLKHSSARAARVEIRYEATMLQLVIDDEGATADRGPAEPAPGHGLLGMRERVGVFGGTLEASPRDGGGFRVNACLPL